MAKLNALDILLGAVSGAVDRVADRNDNPLTAQAAPEVAKAIVAEVTRDPAVLHAVNGEPWYASRVTWGAIIAAFAPLLGLLLGHAVDAGEQAAIGEIATAAGTLIGAGLALYGRWVARAPLGSA
ncbi:hypothetical protein OSH11_00080 [Kaistia dalseonensis]|uniref:Holin n=1 Tax=Kaistia dalseonensis TaxID=410840 RepID=A0ABU0H050_9HYPH|nr:hypothetical protein [Kaistia dalseonensis]MCX5493092.1 hypothetical protein [Kaistia dalseonensis]MDQ0435647.1 hypothetical protein [Kaistia dalseonensis]